jgi:hypothetical protein
MGKMEKGLLGGFTGKLGNVVGFTKNGKYFVRSMPAKRKDKPTAKNLEQRARFALMGSFLKFMAPVVRLTFNQKNIAHDRQCFALNFRNAITGTYPNFSIDYAKVQLACGPLLPAEDVIVNSINSCKLEFTWQQYTHDSCGFDTAVLICYCPELSGIEYSFGPATRCDAKAVLHVPAFRGKLVHSWITFISKAGVADSVYCGSLIVRATKPRNKNSADQVKAVCKIPYTNSIY